MNSRMLTLSLQVRHYRRSASDSRQTGFSIIELMMSVMLLAIAMALAVPSYRDMVEKRQLTYGAEQVMAFVNSAQSEAIRRNEALTVSYHHDAEDDWCFGAVLGITACDCEAAPADPDYCGIPSVFGLEPVPWIINNTHAGNHELIHSMSDGDYSFDPVRGLSDLTGPLVVEMRSDSGKYRLQLRVSSTGQVELCSKDSSHSVPGYGLCPGQITSSTN